MNYALVTKPISELTIHEIIRLNELTSTQGLMRLYLKPEGANNGVTTIAVFEEEIIGWSAVHIKEGSVMNSLGVFINSEIIGIGTALVNKVLE